MIADGRCQVVISQPSGAAAVMTQWHIVWLAVETTVAKCIRAGKGGKSSVPTLRWSSCQIQHEDMPLMCPNLPFFPAPTSLSQSTLSVEVMDEPAPAPAPSVDVAVSAGATGVGGPPLQLAAPSGFAQLPSVNDQ